VTEPGRIPDRRFRSVPLLRPVRDPGSEFLTPAGLASVVHLPVAREFDAWGELWDGQRHDSRYHEIVNGTLRSEYDFRYLVLRDASGEVRTIQPMFVCDQNVLDGIDGGLRSVVDRLRRAAPRLLAFRTLMLGSPVGEGSLPAWPGDRRWCAWALTQALPRVARSLGASLVVLKEFPSALRDDLDVFLHHGYVRFPSMPYVTLDLEFTDFEAHLATMGKVARRDFRRKFREEKRFPPLQMEVVSDISPRLEAVYPLYLQVYERASRRFEKLTPDYFRRLGREMPDRARFFVWSMSGRPVGFYSCLLHDGDLWIDYMGMDYSVALDLHLYFLMKRDAIDWCCRNGVGRYRGGPLNYDPKLHLGCRLFPMDLYVTHLNPLLRAALTMAGPWLSPARYEPILRKFPNAGEM
jgi:hypothetical protein